MKNLWSPRDARACIARYAKDGVGEDLALRVYTSRLLGGEPALVLHGGGNTSVKTTARVLELAGTRFKASGLRPEDDLFDALGIDSVQALELLSEIERAFGVELPDYELAEVRSFADLAAKIDERL